MSEPADRDRDDEPREEPAPKKAKAKPETVIPEGSEQEWHEAPLGKLQMYRTLVNLNGVGAGTWIEIDPEDPAWWGAIESRFIIAEADWQGPERNG